MQGVPSMNWCDFFVLAVIGGFGIAGLKNGFIYSIFRLASFFISVIASVKFYPKVAEFLAKAGLYASVKTSVLKSLLSQKQVLVPEADGAIKQAAADEVVNRLFLPSFFKDRLIEGIPNPSKLVDVDKIMDLVSGEMAKTIVDIISLILLYILIRIGLFFCRSVLQGVAKLPLFKQMNKLGGFAFGAVEGFMTVYVIFTVVMMFNAVPQFKPVFEAMESSVLANFFYQNNFIVGWMFPEA